MSESISFRYISGTTALVFPPGKYCVKLKALEAAVLDGATVCRSCPDSLAGAPIPAGEELEGIFTTVKLVSGKVAAYLS